MVVLLSTTESVAAASALQSRRRPPAKQKPPACAGATRVVRVREDDGGGELLATRRRPGARHGSDDPLTSRVAREGEGEREGKEIKKERRVVVLLPSRTADGRPLTRHRCAHHLYHPSVTSSSKSADGGRRAGRHARSVRRLTGPVVVVVGPTRDFDGVWFDGGGTYAAGAGAGRRCPLFLSPGSPHPTTPFLFSTARRRRRRRQAAAHESFRDRIRCVIRQPCPCHCAAAARARVFVPARRAVLLLLRAAGWLASPGVRGVVMSLGASVSAGWISVASANNPDPRRAAWAWASCAGRGTAKRLLTKLPRCARCGSSCQRVPALLVLCRMTVSWPLNFLYGDCLDEQSLHIKVVLLVLLDHLLNKHCVLCHFQRFYGK